MFQDALIPFITICFAEIGDKSQLSLILLSSKIKNHFLILAGSMAAFLVVDGLAVLFGVWITSVIPAKILGMISGIIFIFFGVKAFRMEHEEGDVKLSKKGAFLSGFAVVFLSEWGDKTQIASALFASQQNPYLVLVGVMAAMFVLSVPAIYAGKVLLKKIDKKTVSKISGILFIVLGVFSVFFSK